MVEVVVTLRDAVMATLFAWGGVGDTQMATTAPLADPAGVSAPTIEKAADPSAKPIGSLRPVTCQA